MPNIVTASELRAVLGVSESLFNDEYLDQMIDSAELTILPLLTQYQSSVVATRVKDSIAYFTTIRPCYFAVGQTVVVTGCGDLNGTYTITADSRNAYEFSVTVAEPDQVIYAVIPSGFATLSGASAAQLYANVAPIKNAILVVSVEVFQSITSPGNQIMGENATPQPFQLGRSLTNRCRICCRLLRLRLLAIIEGDVIAYVAGSGVDLHAVDDGLTGIDVGITIRGQIKASMGAVSV